MAPSSPPPASLRKPTYSDLDASLVVPRQRAQSPSASIASLPYRSHPSISSLFASTASVSSSVRGSGASTPTTETALTGSTIFGDARSASPVRGGTPASQEIRNLIQRAFAPHVGVVASADTDALLKERGFPGGFLQIVRPYGELVSGRVIVRDSIGASRTWDDFGVRFVGMRDGFATPRMPGSNRPSFESRSSEANGSIASARSRISSESRRVGGDIQQIEDVVDRHLNFAELRPSDPQPHLEDHMDSEAPSPTPKAAVQEPPVSPFYSLYIRRLLSGLPLSPHETFSHPVACIIAASSRNPSPIDEFKRLYNSTTTGDDRLPQWVSNDYLRYYVLIHDEDNDDISKSTALYEQMKRHFGLHCHLLRLRSAQCVPSDDDSIRLPPNEWMTAGEELAAIQKRELSEDIEDPTPCLFESDATAIRTFVRELVTQSIVPGMERLCAQWNEQVATRRKGLSGRLLSVGKRWGFGVGRNSGTAAIGSNYDSLQGFYRPDTPEAIMRKLADYSFMLRDFKLAQNTYDVLRSDFDHDNAWKYNAGANEMYLVSTMLNTGYPINKRLDSIERWLETAVHSYNNRSNSPFYAIRTVVLAFEAVKARGCLTIDKTAEWAERGLRIGIMKEIGDTLLMERISSCYAAKPGMGDLKLGGRRRKCGFWYLRAAENWTNLAKTVQAERCLSSAKNWYGIGGNASQTVTSLAWMMPMFQDLQERIVTARLENMGMDAVDSQLLVGHLEEEPLEEVSEDLATKVHRRSIIGDAVGLIPATDAVTAPLSPVRSRQDPLNDEGFE